MKKAQLIMQSGFRTIEIDGAVSGDRMTINEIDDGALITVSTPNERADFVVDADQLADLARKIAGLFDRVVISPVEWKDELYGIIDRVCQEHESRCLDDDIDRRVVINALLSALVKGL